MTSLDKSKIFATNVGEQQRTRWTRLETDLGNNKQLSE